MLIKSRKPPINKSLILTIADIEIMIRELIFYPDGTLRVDRTQVLPRMFGMLRGFENVGIINDFAFFILDADSISVSITFSITADHFIDQRFELDL